MSPAETPKKRRPVEVSPHAPPFPDALPDGLLLRRKLGRGTYGAVFDARWDDQVYAVKVSRVQSPAHAASLDCEATVQRELFEGYRDAPVHLPVYHPFPALYGYFQGQHDGHEARFAAMFRLQRFELAGGVPTMLAHVACVLHTLHAHTTLRFMHRDLHFDNVMQRRTKAFDVAWTADGVPSTNAACFRRGRYVGPAGRRTNTSTLEYALVDFGMARLERRAAPRLVPDNAVYRRPHPFDPQHDLRILVLSLYDVLVADRAKGVERPAPRSADAACVRALVHAARRTSPRFAAVTDLKVLTKIKRLVAGCATEEDATATIEALGARFGDVVDCYPNLWLDAWSSGKPPPLHHFVYGRAVGWGDTPVFAPEGVLARLK